MLCASKTQVQLDLISNVFISKKSSPLCVRSLPRLHASLTAVKCAAAVVLQSVFNGLQRHASGFQ